MNYEKAYKEALERAKKVHKYSSDIAEIKRMEDIFPELAESDDKKIRKAQLDYWRSVGGKEWHGVPVQETIAWLEKQGMQKEYTFKSLPRLLDMIEPTERAKAYCQKLMDTLVKEGYFTDAKIVGECLKQMNGEQVALATMDEKQAPQEIDGFDAELNALLKKYEHLPKEELQEPLEFYLGVVRDDLDVVREDKPKWSEEDEISSDETIELLEYFINYAPEFRKPAIGRSVAWLKSLKQRLGGEE